MSVRNASANWQGTLRDGKGLMAFGTGESAYQGPFSHGSRFAEAEGTNPEELVGAALAGCFSMALAADLGRAGYDPIDIHSKAAVHLEKVEGAQTITRIVLDTEAKVNGIQQDEFLELADKTKDNCPVSRALGGVQVELNAKLLG